MAVRPRRKDPISTRPIYLPRVPARELRGEQGSPTVGEASLRIYVDGVPPGLDVEDLARRLGVEVGRPSACAGDLASALAGRPQTQVRDAVAAAGHRLAWARVRHPEEREYRVLPLRGEVDQEEARLRGRSQPEYQGLRRPLPPAGLLYDGAEVQAAYRELLAGQSEDAAVACVVLTDRQLGRWDEQSKTWTPVSVVSGVPLVASFASAPGGVGLDAAVGELLRALEG